MRGRLRSLTNTIRTFKGFAEAAFDAAEYVTMRAALYGFMAYGLYQFFKKH